jgi:hypothetical protein
VPFRPFRSNFCAPQGETKVVRYSITPPQAGFEGAVTDLVMYAGQGVDDVKDLPTARDLIGRLWAECVASRRL